MRLVTNWRLAQSKRHADARRFRRAFSLLSPLARRGIPEAQVRVARAYLAGHGVPACHGEALKWGERAAHSGLTEAQTLAASLRLSASMPATNGFGPASATPEMSDGYEMANLDMAYFWASNAARAGCPDAMALLAYLHANGPEKMRDITWSAALYRESAHAGSHHGALGYACSLLSSTDSNAAQLDAVFWLNKAAEANLPFAFYLLGLTREQGIGAGPNPAEAVAFYRQAAERGVRPAQFRLGLALLNGTGTAPNLIQGETWLRRAALAGETAAAAAVGAIYTAVEKLPNYLEAAKWYTIAAQAGHKDAARVLGRLYRYGGHGLSRNYHEAAKWFHYAATFQDRETWAELAALIFSGVGTEDIKAQTRQWYEITARTGDRVAAYTLSRFLAEGVGGERDVPRAVLWLRHAADEIVEAQYYLGRTLASDNTVDAHQSEGRIFLEKASSADHRDAMILLAEMLLNGRGGARDSEKALELFLQAASVGHVGAAFAVGTMFCGGHGIKQNLAQARKYLTYAAESGHAVGQLTLGRFLLQASKTEDNVEQARDWLQKAEHQGIAQAAAELECLSIGRK